MSERATTSGAGTEPATARADVREGAGAETRRQARERTGIAAPDRAAAEAREHARDETRGHARDETRGHARDETREHARDETREHARDEAREHARDETREQAAAETPEPIRWGILGTGRIAHVFTEDLALLPDHEVAAVGSRAAATAEAFAAAHHIPVAYGSYDELAADARLDVIYVATPHNAHFSAASSCLAAGRAVLVEKPFTVTAAEARTLVRRARRTGLFAMEAMWMRFNPLIRTLRRLVADGAIGPVQAIYAGFSIAPPYDERNRLWSPALAGGALLDLGVYPLSFTWMLLGRPDAVSATSVAAPTGVDANTGIMLRYDHGAVALLHCGLRADSPQTATVLGTSGRIEVGGPFFRPTSLTLRPSDGGEPRTWSVRLPGHGYTFQAEEVARCLRGGLTESPDMPLEETVAVLELVDEIQSLIGSPSVAAVPAPAGPADDATAAGSRPGPAT